MKLEAYSYTNQGGRDRNEDSVKYRIDAESAVLVLADGLGGHRYGEIASKLAVDVMTDSLEKQSQTGGIDADKMREAFRKANDAILSKRMELQNAVMKTTAVALAVRGNSALWGHIGDSRLYYFSNDEISCVTCDHSVTYKKYLGGEISYAMICEDEDRSSLLRVLGNSDVCQPEISENMRMLREGDAFLLCSDGFWEYLTQEEMLIDYLKSSTPEKWIEYMLVRHAAKARPMNDNFSAIALFAGKEEN